MEGDNKNPNGAKRAARKQKKQAAFQKYKKENPGKKELAVEMKTGLKKWRPRAKEFKQLILTDLPAVHPKTV